MKSGLGILICFSGVISAQTDDSELLSKNAHNITHAARSFGISPRLLASIVYAEQTQNVKPGEKFLDVVFAHSGYNSSVGISQIKVNTAEWIEEQVHSEEGIVANRRDLIARSADRTELVHKLSLDSTNLLYAAAYIAMIENLWGEVLQALDLPNGPIKKPSPGSEGGLQASRTGIIATLYSLGIVRSNGSFRMPHDDPQMSDFGRKAQEFYDSFQLRAEFAK